MSDFFDEFTTGITNAYLVTKGTWQVWNALSAATLTPLVFPTQNCRLSVTLSASTTHTDCAGTITIGTETLTFTAAGRKDATTLLTSAPAITTSGLNCWILIEAYDRGGLPIPKETLTDIEIIVFPRTQWTFISGLWTQTDFDIRTTAEAQVGDVIRFYDSFLGRTRDVKVKAALGGMDIEGEGAEEAFRVLRCV